MAQHRRNPVFGASPDTPSLAELETNKIQPNPYQPRTVIPSEYLNELTASIKEKGQLDPIDVLVNKDEPDTYILVDGQCRLKALEALECGTVLALIRQAGDPHELSLIFNIQRATLHPLDQAASMASLIDRFSYKQEDLARIMSKPRATIAETLSLNKLPDDIKDECRALDIGKTHLVGLVRLLDQPEEMQTLLERIRSGEHVGVRELKGRREGREPPTRPTDIPKAMMPVIRAIETATRARDQLQKISPSPLITRHQQQLHELKELHKEIGGLIKKLERGSEKQITQRRGRRSAAASETSTPEEDVASI